MLDYDFMRMAFAASGAAAVLSGAVGYYLVLRGQTFAGHALSHVGFTGATGAALIGVSPLAGLLVFSAFAGLVMGLVGEKWSERDVAIGMTLSLSLGLGLLFLHFYTSAATQATALLFGNVLGVDASALATLLTLAALSLLALAAIARPLALCEPAGGARRGAGRADAGAFRRVSGAGRGRGGGERGDRRRAAGVRADGRPGGGGAQLDAQLGRRRRAFGRAGAG